MQVSRFTFDELHSLTEDSITELVLLSDIVPTEASDTNTSTFFMRARRIHTPTLLAQIRIECISNGSLFSPALQIVSGSPENVKFMHSAGFL